MKSDPVSLILACSLMFILYLLVRSVSDEAASTRSFMNIGFPITVLCTGVAIVIMEVCLT